MSAPSKATWELSGIKDKNAQAIEPILKLMESGVDPWGPGYTGSLPQVNGMSKNAYRGFNQMIAGVVRMAKNYQSNVWLTRHQIETLGGRTKKGEGKNYIPIVFYATREQLAERKGLRSSDATPAPDGSGQSEGRTGHSRPSRPYLSLSYVYNYDQTEGIDLKKMPATPYPPITIHPAGEADARADEIAANALLCPIVENGSAPCYIPAQDKIRLPQRGQYETLARFHKVRFHEMAHATGHASRLDRLDPDRPGDQRAESYAREELVAEISSIFLCSGAGINMGDLQANTAAYLKHWAGKLRKDPRMLIVAAGQAQKATDWVLGHHPLVQKKRAEIAAEEARKKNGGLEMSEVAVLEPLPAPESKNQAAANIRLPLVDVALPE